LKIYRNNADGIDHINWSFVKDFDDDDLNGLLCIHQEYVVKWKVRNNCEPFELDCYRLIPKVTFEWIDRSGSKNTLDKFTAFYRIDYGNTGLVRIKDPDTVVGAVSKAGLQPFRQKEVQFNAVSSGEEGTYDNIHTIHVPPKRNTVKLPKCSKFPLDCAHQHWRWSSLDLVGPLIIDPMVEPSNDNAIPENKRGTPYLVPDQTIDIAFIRDKPGEREVADPLSLVNNEVIATKQKIYVMTGGLFSSFEVKTIALSTHLGSAVDTVEWYIASVNDKSTATFFRHGFFAEDDSDHSNRARLRRFVEAIDALELNPINKTELVNLLNESVQDIYWLDDSTLNPATGDTVFLLLSNATKLMLQEINETTNVTVAQVMNKTILDILKINIVPPMVSNAVDKHELLVELNSIENYSGLGETLINLSNNINISTNFLIAAWNKSNGDNAIQTIENYRQSWLYAINATIDDTDEDIIPDQYDNCVLSSNDQLDSDLDTFGDVCDVCPLDNTDSCNITENIALTMGRLGGNVTVPSNNSNLLIPEDSLDSSRTVFISGNITNEFNLPAVIPRSLIYIFGPGKNLSLNFSIPVTISIKYDELTVNNESNLEFFLFNETTESYEIKPGNCDPVLNECSINVTELSKAIIGEVTPQNDTDNDGMPDSFELIHPCLNPFVNDSANDSDSDSLVSNVATISMTNIEEYNLGTNPCEADTDTDGFNDGVELYIGTSPLHACGPDGWPLDFDSTTPIPDSINKISITDITSFLAPIRHFGSSVGDPEYDRRWDLTPGKGIFADDINIQDITAMLAGTTGNPPMLGGAKAFGGPECPFPPQN